MPDMEKVKYDIERCICHVPDACRDCSHYKHGEYIDCMEELLKDALSLLKEQDAVEPIKMQRMDSNFSFFVPYYLCGNCRYELVGKDVMFCHHCGKPVKWE